MLIPVMDKTPYRGTRDFFPEDKRIQDALFEHMKRTAESFGYEPYTGPLLEDLNLYRAKSGRELVDEQVYSFEDRGGREMAIRPEMTPTLARMIARRHKELPKPIRWYSIPNLMRYERPQRGRLREHWQLNCDIFGAPEIFSIVELLQILVQLLESFGATKKHFYISINDKRIVDYLFSNMLEVDATTSLDLYKILDKIKKLTPKEQAKLIDNVNVTKENRSKFHDFIELTSIECLNRFIQNDICGPLHDCFFLLNKLGMGDYISYDPKIVRGMDYYTGIVFELFDKNSVANPRSICGGGTYANLLEIFSEGHLSGTGFGLGDVTLTNSLKDWGLLDQLSTAKNDLVIFAQSVQLEEKALSVASTLRKSGLKVLTMLSGAKFNKVKSFAKKNNISYVGVATEDGIHLFNEGRRISNPLSFSYHLLDELINHIKNLTQ